MIIKDTKGNPIVLNSMEQLGVKNMQRQIKNAGYEVDVTTLTSVLKSVTEQKFFEIAPADYLPLVVGEGAWSSNLVKYRSFSLGDDFSTGIINTGSNNSRLASANTMIDSLSIKVANWAKTMGWSIFDLQLASKSGNWDLVTSLEKARLKNWQLGIQKVAFLGVTDDSTNFAGLLNQSGVTVDTTTIPKLMKDMTDAEFTTFATAVYEAYRANCNYTAKPTHFVIPERDYNGLAAPYSASFPLKTKLQSLEETFQMLTQNKNFKILPCAYGNKAIYTGNAVNKYALYNYDEDSLAMNIPVNYTSTLANSIDNFTFQNTAYGQFTGVKAYRPNEMLYFTNTIA